MINKIEISYPVVLSADVWLADFKVKFVNFNVEFVAPLKKWAVAKAKAFLLDKINEYVASTGKTASEFMADFPPCTKEQLVDYVCEGEIIGVISDRYNQTTGKFSVNTMYDIEDFFEIKPQVEQFSISENEQENIVQIRYNSIYNEDEAEERGEARIKLVNFDEEFEDMSWQNVYTKTMTFLLDKINEYICFFCNTLRLCFFLFVVRVHICLICWHS